MIFCVFFPKKIRISPFASSFCVRDLGQGDNRAVKTGFFSGVKINMCFNLVISGSILFFALRVINLTVFDRD